jgi:hypothetical protein
MWARGKDPPEATTKSTLNNVASLSMVTRRLVAVAAHFHCTLTTRRRRHGRRRCTMRMLTRRCLTMAWDLAGLASSSAANGAVPLQVRHRPREDDKSACLLCGHPLGWNLACVACLACVWAPMAPRVYVFLGKTKYAFVLSIGCPVFKIALPNMDSLNGARL